MHTPFHQHKAALRYLDVIDAISHKAGVMLHQRRNVVRQAHRAYVDYDTIAPCSI